MARSSSARENTPAVHLATGSSSVTSPRKARSTGGPVNKKISTEHFDHLLAKIQTYLKGREVFVQDCFGGAAPDHALPIRTVHELAWHSLFARQLFVSPEPGSTVEHVPELTVLYAPGAQADPETDGTHSEAFIVLNLARKMVIIGGTSYAGEMKKSVFTTLNYLLPDKKVFPMHCSANEGPGGDVALFFGLSGTGKTTLSADPGRRLIGDDEHGWSDDGIFNFEGGCYAKCIRLSKKNEPQIWNAIRFGSVGRERGIRSRHPSAWTLTTTPLPKTPGAPTRSISLTTP